MPSLQHLQLESLSLDAVQSHKQNGNTAFAKQDYTQAVHAYTRGLQVCEDDEPRKYDLHRNRAMAHMYLGHYEMSLSDAKAAVIPAQQLATGSKELNAKAFYRAGCAAYNLERFSAAASFFERVLELTPNDTDAQRELKRADNRLEEASTGRYDFETMTRKLQVSSTHRLDHASFTSNVEARSTKDKGRGHFALQDMEASELVMCEKAFCTAGFAEDDDGTTSMIVNLVDNSMSVGTHAARFVKVIQKLLNSPQGAARFLELYDGDYKPRPTAELVDGVVAVDTYQVHSALNVNGFSCCAVASSVPEEDESTLPTGVWLVSSAINHSCIGNVSRTFVGDLLLLRANKHIRAGEEILMRYQNPKGGIAQFHAMLKQTWGFTCACKLCHAELNVPGYQRNIRASAIARVAALMEANPISESTPPSLKFIDEVEQLRDQILNTYSDVLFTRLPRPALHMVHVWLCMAYETQGMGDAVLDTSQRVFRDLGIGITEEDGSICIDRSNSRLDMAGLHAAMYAAQIERMRGRDSVAQQYEDFGNELYLVLCGSMHGFDTSLASSH